MPHNTALPEHHFSAAKTNRWWHRPVTLRQALLSIGLGIFIWLMTLGTVVAWLYCHWQGHAYFHDQRLGMQLPDRMLASADLQSTIQTQLNTDVKLRIPINQQLAVDLPGTAEGQSHVDLRVPIQTNVAHAFTLNFLAKIDTHVSVASWLPDLHVQFELPMSVPISLNIPVRGDIPLSLDLHAFAHLPKTVHVPVQTRVNVQVPINQALRIAATSRAQFALHATEENLPVVLTQAHLHMPLSDLVLQPTRLTSDNKASSNSHSTTDRQINPTALRR